jgi:hypothetical protein
MIQTAVEVPGDVRINLYLLSTGEAVLSPRPNWQATYEHVPEGVSSFMDGDGLILWEKGSKEYEYDFNTAYLVAQEPLLRGYLRQQGLQSPD